MDPVFNHKKIFTHFIASGRPLPSPQKVDKVNNKICGILRAGGYSELKVESFSLSYITVWLESEDENEKKKIITLIKAGGAVERRGKNAFVLDNIPVFIRIRSNLSA